MTKKDEIMIADEIVMNKIYLIRGQKVMLDSDLASLYGVETKRLKEQVKRNINRFPEKHAFELTAEEFEILKSQFLWSPISTSKTGRRGTRYLPMVFTEHGVLQLSNVLKSERAQKVSFFIIDVFIKIREMLTDNIELRLAINKIKRTTDNNTKNIELVFQYLDQLLEKSENSDNAIQNPIGFVLPQKDFDENP
jgi:hypothetical protein